MEKSTTSFFKSLLPTDDAKASSEGATPRYLPHTKKYLAIGGVLAAVTVWFWFNPPLDARARLVLEIDSISREYEQLALETQELQSLVDLNHVALEALAQEAATMRDSLATFTKEAQSRN